MVEIVERELGEDFRRVTLDVNGIDVGFVDAGNKVVYLNSTDTMSARLSRAEVSRGYFSDAMGKYSSYMGEMEEKGYEIRLIMDR